MASMGRAGVCELEIAEPITVARAIDMFRARHPELEYRLSVRDGQLRRDINVFVGEDNIRDLNGMDTLCDGSAPEIWLIPPESGG